MSPVVLAAIALAAATALSALAARFAGPLLGGRVGGREVDRPPRPPRLGGMAVLATTVAVGLASGVPLPAAWSGLWPWVLAVYALGLLDDLLDLPARLKLAVQVLVCLVLSTRVSLSPVSVPDGQGLDLGVFAVPVTAFWLLLVMNAFNIVDGADGLAGGLCALIAAALALLAARHGHGGLVEWLAVYAAAHAGFLWLNWKPARLYLGDAGSLGAGITLGIAGLTASNPVGATVGLHTNLLLFWLPLTETALTVGRRLLRGQPLFRGDDRHMHHILAARGWRLERGVAMLLGLAALAATAAVVSSGWRRLPVAALIVGLVLATVVGVLALGYVELRVLGHRLRQLVRRSWARGHTLVLVAEAAQRVRGAASREEVARALDALVSSGVLAEAHLVPRGPGAGPSAEATWALDHEVGDAARPGYTLRLRSRADEGGRLRPEDVRAYLVPALAAALARIEAVPAPPSEDSA